MSHNLASLALSISTSVPLSLIVKATVVIAAGLVLVRAMPRARAARRSVVLVCTFGMLAALPLVVAFAPSLPVVVRESRQMMAPTSSAGATAIPAVAGRQVAAAPVPAMSHASADRDPIASLGAAIWATGTVVFLIPVLTTFYRLRVLRRTAGAWNRADVPDLARTQLLVHKHLTAPMTFGWLKPSILLPPDADTWAAADLQRALVHEMEHVRRRDWPVHVLARLVCAVYWFHPFVWTAWRQLRLEADRACDDAVASSSDAREFAEQLVTLAGRIRSSAPAPALSMAGGSLIVRVHALMNPNQARGRSGLSFAIATCLAAIAVGTTVAAVEAVQRTSFERSPMPPRTAAVSPKQTPAASATGAVRSIAPRTHAPAMPLPSVSTRETPAAEPQSAALQPQNSAPTVEAPDYIIGAADVLTITFWRDKDLTNDYVVRPDGRITLPLINDVLAVGLTPEQLRDRLTKLFSRFLQDPQLTVGVKSINPRKVYVLGGVQKPGPYDLLRSMTPMHLIAVAGGLRDFVTGTDITIIRLDDGKQLVLRFNYREVVSGKGLKQNIVLKPGDTVVVPD